MTSDCLSDGSWKCECNIGFVEQHGTCHDLNECVQEFCNLPNSNCTNTVGSYKCECLKGFEIKGDSVSDISTFTCEDIDECMVREYNCLNNSTCENTVGSYMCVCNEGYTERDLSEIPSQGNFQTFQSSQFYSTNNSCKLLGY